MAQRDPQRRTSRSSASDAAATATGTGTGMDRSAAKRTSTPAAADTAPPPVERTEPTTTYSPTGRTDWWDRGTRSAAATLAIVALVLGILIGGFTAYYEYTRPSTYASRVVLLIDQPGVISSTGDVGVINKLAQLRLKYAGLVRTEVFSGPVAQRTGLPEPEVRASLSDVIDPNSLLFSITSTTGNPTTSHNIARAAGDELTEYVRTEQDQANVPSRLQVTFTVVTPASPGVRVSPDRRRAELVGLLVFLAITIAGLVAADLLRRRRRA